MQLVHPSASLMRITHKPLELIEEAGRTCWKSLKKPNVDSSKVFLDHLIDKGHFSVIEHAVATVRVICDRGVTHEIVRHRLASYSQESTRYCNYKGGVTFIIPCWLSDLVPGPIMLVENSELGEIIESPQDAWVYAMAYAERRYVSLIKHGWTPQQARSVLPNSLKTEIVITYNFREWLHFFDLRCDPAAHPQMQQTANQIKALLHAEVPELF